MKKSTLSILKITVSIAGMIITLIGVFHSIKTDGDSWSTIITVSGVTIIFIGFLASLAESRKQEAEKHQLEARLQNMNERIKEAYNRTATYA